jgi:hypothetical protein
MVEDESIPFLEGSRQSEWERDVLQRAGGFLEPARLKSLLVIVPGVSGDVALSTTLIRAVRKQSPACRILFATDADMVPVARLCPAVDDILVLPPMKKHGYSRTHLLEQYRGQASAVVYASCIREDIDLLERYTPVEALWIVSGMRQRPQGKLRLWIKPPVENRTAEDVLNERAGHHLTPEVFTHRAATWARAALRYGKATLLRTGRRAVAGAALRNEWAKWSPKPSRRNPLLSETDRLVVLSTGSHFLQPPSQDMVTAMVDLLNGAGWMVLHHVLDPKEAAVGTIPLVCDDADFLRLREAGIPFVGWRSGHCDIAAGSSAPMCVFYPAEGPFVRPPLEILGFESMNIQANCLEVVCRDVADIQASQMIEFLNAEVPHASA